MAETIIARFQKGNLLLANQANERLPAVYDTQTIEVRSSGYTAGGTNYIKIDGVIKLTTGRGVGLVRLDYYGGFVDATNYDTYGSTTNVTNLIDAINGTPDGYTLIFSTYDEPQKNNQPLRDLLTTLGFSLLTWNARCAWLGIIQKGTKTPIDEQYADGDLSTTIVTSKQILPKNVIYFPYDGTTNSTSGISPSSEGSLTKLYKGVGIEEPATNNFVAGSNFESLNVGDTNGFTNQLGSNSILGVVDYMAYEGLKCLRIKNGTGGSDRCYKNFSVALGSWQTCSADVYSEVPGTYLRIEYNTGNYAWQGAESARHTGSGWERLVVTFYEAATSASMGYFFIYPGHQYDIYVDNIRNEAKPFATCYTPLKRTTNGFLYYPRELVNYNGNFSIVTKFKIPYMYRALGSNAGIQGNWYHPIIELCPTSNQGDTGLSVCAGPEPAPYSRMIMLRSPGGIQTGIAIQDGTWYTMVLNYNGTDYKLYIDGALQITYTGGSPVVYTDSKLMVGGGYFGATDIVIDNVTLFNRILIDEEITKMSNNPLTLSIDKNGNLNESIEEGLNLGTGKDGVLTVSAANTVVNKYAYVTSNLVSGSLTTCALDDVTGFNAGDEVMIIQMQNSSDICTVGNYEFIRIGSVDVINKTLTFIFPIAGNYYSGTPNAISATTTQIVRVPNYTSITINAASSITCDTWNGQKGGIVIFRCQGDITNNGSIDASGKGYRGGRVTGQDGYGDPAGDGECGEGYTGMGLPGFYSSVQPYAKDGGGVVYVNGCGGSYATQGTLGTQYDTYTQVPSFTYGHDSLCNLYLGSGGAGGHNNGGQPHGGNGGGIIAIYTKTINGSVACNGQNAYFNATQGLWGAGGGSGGTIYVEAETCTTITSVVGGVKANGTSHNGGDGGLGRVRIFRREGITQEMSVRKDRVIIKANMREMETL